MQYRQSIFGSSFLKRLRNFQPTAEQFYAMMSYKDARAFTALVKFEHMASPNCGPPPENTVSYRLFPASTREKEPVTEDELTCLAVKCTELAKKLAGDHVWHYDTFSLGVWPSNRTATGMRGMCLFICRILPQQPRD